MLANYKFMKICDFPESMFYIDRMVGYGMEPRVFVRVEREAGSSNSIRATFHTKVHRVAPCDHSRTIETKVSVSLVTLLDKDSNEVTERVLTGHTPAYRKVDYGLRKEIETHLNESMNRAVRALQDDRLEEWLSVSKVREIMKVAK